jgi:hypothetical protein
MKQFIVITCLALALASCNNADQEKKDAQLTEVKAAPVADVKLPIPLEKPYRNWQIGSTENVVAAMNALKSYVDKDFTALAATIGDSLELQFDNYYATMSRDSVIKFFAADRPKYTDLKITMYDYVSVISADKKEEWVTMWYKQSWKNEKGAADSIAVTDDVKLKNGKMIELDEKTQHIPAKK